MPHPKHEEVRQRYGRRRGYCGVTETETGGELTVDHFRPVTAGGDDAAENLVYACFRCNSYKGDFFPSTGDARNGRRLLHAYLDRFAEHIREEALAAPS
jgi:5-methylcytosine-specific restriction endonuclease McrA